MGRDVYVARDGDDANPGTKDQPLASPAKAVQWMCGVGPGTIWVGPGEYYLETGLAFDAQHVFEELEQPGEHYLDRQHNRLYFWPPGDLTETPVRLTLCRQPLVRADGSAYLTLRDLTVENGCDAGIVMHNGRHCRVEVATAWPTICSITARPARSRTAATSTCWS